MDFSLFVDEDMPKDLFQQMDLRAMIIGLAGGPLLKIKKVVIMHPTFFNEKVYREKGFKAAMEKTIDDWSLKYPGIENVDHIYFHYILSVSPGTRKKYPEIAYLKGKELKY